MNSIVPGGFVIRGRLLRVAALTNEWYEELCDPEKASRLLCGGPERADILTFIQRLPQTEPEYEYHMEWDNVATIQLDGYDHWWTSQIPKSCRKHIRRAQRAGVEARLVPFDDALAKGILEVYNETPLRQGRPFSHYGEDLDSIKRTHSTFPGRRDFIGAYLDNELIGFVSLIYAGETARSVQLITKVKYRDKWPTNVLLSKAVEICCEKGVRYLVYGKFDYGKAGGAGLASFKSENGFEKMLIPRYYIPLNRWGQVALACKLHHGLVERLPGPVVSALRNMRCMWHRSRYCGARLTR